MPASQAPVGLLGPAGEAVQHRAFGNAFGIEHVEQVGPGVAGVNDQCEVVRVGQPDLRRERVALGGTRRVLVVVVESALAHRDHCAVARPEPLEPAAPPPRRRPGWPRAGAARLEAHARGDDPVRAVARATSTACREVATPVPMHTRPVDTGLAGPGHQGLGTGPPARHRGIRPVRGSGSRTSRPRQRLAPREQRGRPSRPGRPPR